LSRTSTIDKSLKERKSASKSCLTGANDIIMTQNKTLCDSLKRNKLPTSIPVFSPAGTRVFATG